MGKKRASSGENGDQGPKEKKNKNSTDFSTVDFATKECNFKVR